MPPNLALHFLGSPQLYLNNDRITIQRRKSLALLAYLSIERGQHQRDSLSSLLWPDYEQSKAFANLRNALLGIQKSIGENRIIADRESIGLKETADIWLDTAQFDSLLEKSQSEPDISLRTSLLADAAKLYRNHFLTGFSLKDAYSFNEWAYAESEDLRLKFANVLTMLSKDHCALGQADQAIPFARRLITLDPLNETSHCLLMDVYIQAGQHSEALKQYQTLEQILRKELNLDPQPETRELYKRIRKGDIHPIPKTKQTEIITPEHNLPHPLTSFIGRKKEEGEIIDLVTKNRLVTLAGIGGIGKTSLSIQVGRKLLNQFNNGVWFIPLDSLSDPALVPQTVASVFGIKPSNNEPVIETLTRALRENAALLILDNCEHLLDACAELTSTLLTNCPNIKVLATSREVLNISGEATYQMPSLSLPEQDEISLDNLTKSESVRLFSERATLALSSFELTNENASTVIEICRKLDGIPLAIELAAAYVNILQVNEILDQLNASFSLLASDSRTTSTHHQTLQASMDWSWGLLNKAEQTFLQQLSVFAGGWTLESSQAVCDGDVFDLTNALVKKSLIVVNQTPGSETRYRFHEIVRQYMREKLSQSGKGESIRDQHLAYFVRLVQRSEPEFHQADQVFWKNKIDEELDNIRLAMEWAITTNTESGLQLVVAINEYSNIRGNTRELGGWLTRLLEQHNMADSLHARALEAYAHNLGVRGNTTEAQKIAREGLDLSRAISNRNVEAWCLFRLGWVIQDKDLLEQSIALFQELGDKWGQARAIEVLAENTSLDREKSKALLIKALELHRDLGNLVGMARCNYLIAQRFIWSGEFSSAMQLLDESLETHRQLGNRQGEAFILICYGDIAYWQGNYQQASTYFQQAISLLEKIGVYFIIWYRTKLAYTLLKMGNITQAREIFGDCVRSFQKVGLTTGVVFSIEGLAGVFAISNKPKVAALLIGWADATREDTDDTRPLVEQQDVDKIIEACLKEMGEASFSDEYETGKKMSMDDVIAFALYKD
ncbi:MAG TPA: BTAD domain-containing putative transcriptional regulator [Anaerolineales bacterium]|nr:BTAD domain-containing putative transcriptional regulator [Anaerolineales bacterium]